MLEPNVNWSNIVNDGEVVDDSGEVPTDGGEVSKAGSEVSKAGSEVPRDSGDVSDVEFSSSESSDESEALVTVSECHSESDGDVPRISALYS